MASRGLNLRRFLSASSLYAIGDLLTKGARFVLVPYYVHVLTKSEIGTLGVLQAISIASWTLFAFGFGLAIPRFYFQYRDQADRFVAAVWWSRMLGSIGPCLLLVGLSYLAVPKFMPAIPVHLVTISMLSGFLRAGFNIIESWFMIREQPIRYRTFTVMQFVTTTVLIIYLVSFRRLGVAGAVLGEFISYALWTVISGWLVGVVRRSDVTGIEWRPLLRYCTALLPHTFFMWAIAYSDRVILQQFVSLKDMGVYELGHTLASALSVAALAMRAAWVPSFFRRAGEEAGRREYAQTASYFCSITFLVAAGLIIFAPEAMWIVTTGGYEDAVLIMRLIVVGLVGQALFMGLNQPLLYEGKNALLSGLSFVATVLNIGLNFWWIPRWGILGAGLTHLATYFVLVSIAFVFTRQYYRVRWQWGTLLGGCAATIVAVAAGCGLPPLALPATLGAKVLISAALCFVLAVLLRRQHGSDNGLEVKNSDVAITPLSEEAVPAQRAPTALLSDHERNQKAPLRDDLYAVEGDGRPS